ncbi:hypothetical protein G647_00316 [Cladophialophora carrionii CBS 160.54]|uniref:Glycosyltransferase 2-like domain-containing protein n=1 Tax=Cladophialophora carrionii CBS 160.54 TaxID=1279043 RepID=V9DPK5_9EURO|nr:uncharacterized protein G647_00316 [Cladophialophora carrionii CBS 160.54]ETI27867.1 hypothetical protein G647_00316 [Cladophialophora carrionii CBS 160.54]
MADSERSILRHRGPKKDKIDTLTGGTETSSIADGVEDDITVVATTGTESAATVAQAQGEDIGTIDFDTDEEFNLPPVPPNTPAEANLPVIRDYAVVTSSNGEESLVWHATAAAYLDGVEMIEQEKADAVTLGTLLSDALTPINVINTVIYLALLCANAKSSKLISPATLFALAQINENLGTITEGLWKTVITLARNRNPRPSLRLLGNNVPSVDVFVVCCGEPDDVVLDTVKAACKIDWPTSKFRVIVADDGNSLNLRNKIQQMQGTYTNLHYYSRVKPAVGHHGYKAGNLNATLLDYVEKTPAGYSEYCAIFDADMMPEPNILRVLVPHAIKDPNLAMVTAAQFHYNVPKDDPLNQGNTTGTGAEDGNRDRVNAAWCPGSGFVLRTAAWHDIKGFPEFSITEDLITSWCLHGKGHKIALIPGVMQWGLQPDCLITHLKQRRRWWTGHIRDALRYNFTLNAEALSGASLIQRYAMFHHACRPYTMTITHTINTLLTLVCLWLGGPVIGGSDIRGLKQIVYCLAISRAIGLIGDVKSIFSGSYLKVRRMIATGVWMGHHFSRDTLQTLLPQRLGGLRLGFGVSGVEDKPQIGVKERNVASRPALLTRVWMVHQREGILWHLALFLVTVALVLYRVVSVFKTSTVNGQVILSNNFWTELVKSVGFPGLALIDNVLYYLTPIFYMIDPPTMPERRETMKYEPDTGLWKPREEYKKVLYTRAS